MQRTTLTDIHRGILKTEAALLVTSIIAQVSMAMLALFLYVRNEGGIWNLVVLFAMPITYRIVHRNLERDLLHNLLKWKSFIEEQGRYEGIEEDLEYLNGRITRYSEVVQ